MMEQINYNLKNTFQTYLDEYSPIIKKVRVAIYIRVSTEEQKINGLSVETQKDALTEHALQNNMEIVDYYIDAGLTARKKLSHRKELLRLLKDVEKGLIDVIIFTKLDRWFRNIADYYKVQEKLDKYKVNWKTIYEIYDTSTANGRLHINIMLSIAQDEADRTSERIKAVFENKRSKGETPANRAPLGYKIENSKLFIDEDTSQIALDIFNYYDTHHSLLGCVRLAKEKYDYKIYDYSVRRMFVNTIYIGEFRGHKDFCEPLIDRDMFYRIQNYRGVREFKNQLTAGRTYLFSTLILCKECKHTMTASFTIQKQKHGPKEFHYYRCREAVVNYACNHTKCINEEALENYLLNNIKCEMQETLVAMEKRRLSASVKKNDTAKTKKRMEKLKDLYLDDLIDKDSYKQEYALLTAQLDSIVPVQPAATEKYKAYLEQDINSLYEEMSPAERKIFWLGIIDRIVIDRENNIDFFLRE
ncbi:Site-specific DNA recombinase [Anaerocolumna xylanovorans DSM 12503]|uniref:Site-specific DNA recombinase n=2 Tax=Anaerocolumna TaxID=1843210 RepID=A0A1M7Y3S6_9FIRM|nr:Site-specific DNA recombinase [Anaerocolumna xylanovorans DSM 12503]